MDDYGQDLLSGKVDLSKSLLEISPNADTRSTEYCVTEDKDSGLAGTSERKHSGDRKKEAKTTLKRKANSVTDANNKKKKKKKAKVYRRPRLGYTVQEGEDMLLIISNTNQYDSIWKPKRKNAAKGKAKLSSTKRKSKTTKIKIKDKAFDSDVSRLSEINDDRWGQNLPVEVLVNVFQMVVKQEGAVPFLTRVARVCQLWNCAAANPVLWRSVSLGYCWIEPGKAQLPKMELKIKGTVSWLAQNRFSQLREFSLCHWKKLVDYVVQVVSQSCPYLTSLKLSYCSGASEKSFQALSSCPSLESINVQYSEFQVEGLVTFLETYGSQIRKFLFTYGSKSERLLAVIARGCCPELKLLEVNTKLDSGFCQLPLCIHALQSGCPKLQVFRMLNVTPIIKTTRKNPSISYGFPHLDELCMATSAVSFMTDQHLASILHGSPRLRVLDLRGCARITAAALSMLPCEEIECLYWGLYYSSDSMVSSKKGLHLLTEKWSRTLKELDLTCQPFLEEDLEIAIVNLALSTGAELLRSLNLSSTKINTRALRTVISQCSELNYLNLSSCRYLPRGLKRVYRCQEDIHQLLDKLG